MSVDCRLSLELKYKLIWHLNHNNKQEPKEWYFLHSSINHRQTIIIVVDIIWSFSSLIVSTKPKLYWYYQRWYHLNRRRILGKDRVTRKRTQGISWGVWQIKFAFRKISSLKNERDSIKRLEGINWFNRREKRNLNVLHIQNFISHWQPVSRED